MTEKNDPILRWWLRPFFEAVRDRLGDNLIGVEVGVSQGTNARGILREIPKIKMLHLVDNYQPPWDGGFAYATQKLSIYETRIAWRLKSSVEAAQDFEDEYRLEFRFLRGAFVIAGRIDMGFFQKILDGFEDIRFVIHNQDMNTLEIRFLFRHFRSASFTIYSR